METEKEIKEYEELLEKIKNLPERERIKVDAYATALADAARMFEKDKQTA